MIKNYHNCIMALCLLSGCGTTVPKMEELYETKDTEYPLLSASGLLVFNIKRRVYCDIAQAVSDNIRKLPQKWGVQVTLDLQVDETGAFNPGTSFSSPLNAAESAGVNFGASVSSQSTREDKIGSYWELEKLVGDRSCSNYAGSSLLLKSDLGISQWLNDALIAAKLTPSSALTKSNEFKQDFISYRVRFLVTTSGNINPTYKLINFSGNNGTGNLLTASRVRTHDLLITFGPMFKTGGLNIAANSHTAQEFGIAVANAARNISSTVSVPALGALGIP